MYNHPIENLMDCTMENLKNMIDVNTIIGDSITAQDGTVIVPISKVSFGFASGGSEFSPKTKSDNEKYPFGGGAGAGVSVKPVAFLVVKPEGIRLLPMDSENTEDRIIDAIPQLIDVIKGFFSKDKKENCCKSSKDSSNSSSENVEGNEYSGEVVVEDLEE